MFEFIQIGPCSSAAGKQHALPVSVTPRVVRLQVVTLVWMLAECGISLASARRARSPALLAFGSDSFVELLSAAAVLLQFLPSFPLSKGQTARLAGILLLALAGVVALTTILALVLGVQPETSLPGMVITVAALVAMPILAWKKRSLARKSNNRALAADAVQSATCAYLALITLAGLGANALFHHGWVDSATALLAIPILVTEGRRAVRSESCGCC